MLDIISLFPEKQDIPEKFSISEVTQNRYLVNGQIRTWNGPLEEVYSPVCVREKNSLSRVLLGHHPLLTENEAMEALQAAVKAYDGGMGAWPTMSVEERIQHVREFASLMKGKREEVVRLLMWEIGKSYADSQKEFDRTFQYIMDTIDALKEQDRVASRFTIEEGIIGQIRRSPLGVVLCMGPYNYPLNETFATLIPALIMGNAIIFKPARFGVLLYEPLLEAFRDAFPKGVVNTVYGDGEAVILPMMRTGLINVLAFIGSSRVANILKSNHPKLNRLRGVLGLEAKNAAIILEDTDMDTAVQESLLGSLSFNGQRCTALKIIFVHENIAETFIKRYNTALKELKFGMPWEENVKITPLPENGKTEYLKALVEDAVQHGASVMNEQGGDFAGTFFYPALLYPVNEKMRVYHEEQFGPVVPVIPFKDVETPINYIADSPYGQQLSIFGRDSGRIASLIDPLVNQVCRVNINTQCQRQPDTFPFTGRKDSAEGTLSVSDALRAFSIRTLVAAKNNDLNDTIIKDIVRNRKSNFLSTDFIF